jgi:hypothetical protein
MAGKVARPFAGVQIPPLHRAIAAAGKSLTLGTEHDASLTLGTEGDAVCVELVAHLLEVLASRDVPQPHGVVQAGR